MLGIDHCGGARGSQTSHQQTWIPAFANKMLSVFQGCGPERHVIVADTYGGNVLLCSQGESVE